MKLSGAIFDLDGTLLDSMPFWETVGSRYLIERGIPAPEDLPLRLKTMTLREAAVFYRQDFGVTESEETICRQVSEMIEEDYRSRAPLKAGARDVLEQLRQRCIPMCIATATDRRLVELALHRLGIFHFFSFIVTCGELNTSKNQPDIFAVCARRLGTQRAETVVFEDSLHCIRTASRAGFPVVGIYDSSADSEREEIRPLCEQYLVNWEDFCFV